METDKGNIPEGRQQRGRSPVWSNIQYWGVWLESAADMYNIINTDGPAYEGIVETYQGNYYVRNLNYKPVWFFFSLYPARGV